MRCESDKPAKNGGWLHKREGAKPMIMAARKKQAKRLTDAELHMRFAPLCRHWWQDRGGKSDRLAEQLSVAYRSLDEIRCGWDGEAWTVPERTPRGYITGVSRRLADGNKLCVPGSRRGLVFSDTMPLSGQLLIVEGASDVAAGITLGLAVVGRPQNIGGVEQLVRFIRPMQNRKIIIIAERDEKDRTVLQNHKPRCRCCNQCYPGKYGAIQTSIKLSNRLQRLVGWTFLPDGAKDLRGWLNGKRADPNNLDATAALGQSLLRRIDKGIKE